MSLKFLYSQLFVTPAELPASLDLRNKTGIVTGSNVGLGLEACRQLLDRNLSRLILAVRSKSKGDAARSDLLNSHAESVVDVWEVDLDSYSSIKAFADQCKTLPQIDFIILNAAVVKQGFELNDETHNEVTVQVNWLSTALLTVLLVPIMDASTAVTPRLTIVGSEVAEWAAFKQRKHVPILAEMNNVHSWDPYDRYNTSKLLIYLFFRDYVNRVTTRVIVNMVNPGLCKGSSLHRDLHGVSGMGITAFKSLVGRKSSIGARTLSNAAVLQTAESHGQYSSDCNIQPPLKDITSGEPGISAQLWDETVKELSKTINVSDYIRT